MRLVFAVCAFVAFSPLCDGKQTKDTFVVSFYVNERAGLFDSLPPASFEFSLGTACLVRFNRMNHINPEFSNLFDRSNVPRTT
jgi:hypothetical protein